MPCQRNVEGVGHVARVGQADGVGDGFASGACVASRVGRPVEAVNSFGRGGQLSPVAHGIVRLRGRHHCDSIPIASPCASGHFNRHIEATRLACHEGNVSDREFGNPCASRKGEVVGIRVDTCVGDSDGVGDSLAGQTRQGRIWPNIHARLRDGHGDGNSDFCGDGVVAFNAQCACIDTSGVACGIIGHCYIVRTTGGGSATGRIDGKPRNVTRHTTRCRIKHNIVHEEVTTTSATNTVEGNCMSIAICISREIYSLFCIPKLTAQWGCTIQQVDLCAIYSNFEEVSGAGTNNGFDMEAQGRCAIWNDNSLGHGTFFCARRATKPSPPCPCAGACACACATTCDGTQG